MQREAKGRLSIIKHSSARAGPRHYSSPADKVLLVIYTREHDATCSVDIMWWYCTLVVAVVVAVAVAVLSTGACTLLVGYWPSRSSEATQPAQQALVVSGRLLEKLKGGESTNMKAVSKAKNFHARCSHCQFAVRSATVGAVGPNLSHEYECHSGCTKHLLKQL